MGMAMRAAGGVSLDEKAAGAAGSAVPVVRNHISRIEA
jgi:hypothetical protein